jgi:hypothetical protein
MPRSIPGPQARLKCAKKPTEGLKRQKRGSFFLIITSWSEKTKHKLGLMLRVYARQTNSKSTITVTVDLLRLSFKSQDYF